MSEMIRADLLFVKDWKIEDTDLTYDDGKPLKLVTYGQYTEGRKTMWVSMYMRPELLERIKNNEYFFVMNNDDFELKIYNMKTGNYIPPISDCIY